MSRKTLSGSEMYAHCRNRHEQKHLRERLENLSEKQFMSMDFIKMETNKWRQFRRENLKNSGCSAEVMRHRKKGKELISLKSCPPSYPRARLFKEHLQLPWVYTYNTDSHNQVCKDLLQSSINYKRSLSLRHHCAKNVRSSKRSMSLSAESSGNDSPRTSMQEERNSARQLPRTKNAWVYSMEDWRKGESCPPNTPKSSFDAKTPSSTGSDFPENHDIVFVTELKEPQKLMKTQLFSVKAGNQNVNLEWIAQTSHEHATNADLNQTERSSCPQSLKDMRKMNVLCAACGGKLTNNERNVSQSRNLLDIRKRIKSTGIDIVTSNQRSHESALEDFEDIRKDKTKLCRCNSEPSLMHNNASTLTIDTVESHFGISHTFCTNPSVRFSPTKINGLEDDSIQEDPEDILASSFYLWDLPPYKSIRGNRSCTHLREHPTESESILNDCCDQKSNEASVKPQPLNNDGNSRPVLLPKRRHARDETVNRIDLTEIQKHGDRYDMVHEEPSESDKCDPNAFQLQAAESSQTKFSDSSEKRQRLPTSLDTHRKHQMNISDCSKETFQDRLITHHRARHIPPIEQSTMFKEKGNKDNNDNDNKTAFHERKPKTAIISKDSITMIAKTDKSEEKRPLHGAPRISSGKNGALCGIPKVLQRKSQNLRSQRPSVPGHKANPKRHQMPTTANNSETGERLVRSDSGVKSRQKPTLIKINVRIPQVVKDEISVKDTLIETLSTSKMDMSVTVDEKGPETNDDTQMNVMENCNEENQTNPESPDKFYPNHSIKNPSIHTEGIKDPFIFSDTATTTSDDKEKVNNIDNSRIQENNNDETFNIDDTKTVTNTIKTNDSINNNNNNRPKDYISDNSTKNRGRTMSAFGRLMSGNDDVYHKGILLSNYVSPEQRYKMTFKGPRSRHRLSARSHSFVSSPVTNSNSYVIRLNFSKQARQQALTKLIEDNHSARGNSIQKAIEESLQARIKAFCVSLDPYRQSTCM